MASFDNATIKAPTRKPHICIREGLWRVSKARPAFRNGYGDWRQAHEFIMPLNKGRWRADK